MTEAVSRAIIHAGTVFCCTGQLITLYAPAIFFEVPYLNLTYVVTHILNHAVENPQAKLHECIRCYFNFKKVCWCDHLNIIQTNRIESLMFEIIARWESTLNNIEQMAQASNLSAKWVMGAARLNRHAIYQRYTTHMQGLADKLPSDQIHPASIEDTIRWTFGFNDGQLFDTPNNI